MKEAKENCVFCKILAGELPASMIYEDNRVAVFIDLYPVNEGHLLVVPKYHAPYMKDVDTDTLQHIMKIAKAMNEALRKTTGCEGVNLFVADGEAAHQEVFHFHLHLYPRFTGDGFGFRYNPSIHFKELPRNRMDELAQQIKSNFNKEA